jgi:hypothetical protein
LIEKRHPAEVERRKEALEGQEEEKRVSKSRVDHIPILKGLGLHLLPGMNTILTVRGRQGMDLVHHITQGNRRFLLMKDPSTDMRGFILELKRVIPTGVRGETLLEVVGVERFLADVVYIPEERRGLYLNEEDALYFANGKLVKDREPTMEDANGTAALERLF